MAETFSKLSKDRNFQTKVTEGVTEQDKGKQIHIQIHCGETKGKEKDLEGNQIWQIIFY